ncbi:MAG: hypothetical protein MI861_20315, partial [Pirellulales bacterium]|nr:hypothetical protein [Pirellulales bacterium]
FRPSRRRVNSMEVRCDTLAKGEVRWFVLKMPDEPTAATYVAQAPRRVIAIKLVEVKPLIAGSWQIGDRKVICPG